MSQSNAPGPIQEDYSVACADSRSTAGDGRARNDMILVVEDEPLIRLMIVDLLQAEGFTVAEAVDADDALTILADRADEVKLIFTDINMPGDMDGLQLARHAVHSWPWIELLVTSGRGRPASPPLPSGSIFVEKPYTFDKLLGCIRDLTHQR